ncbi:FUSC family protein [Streptomyces alkaliterrae]|uniref:FUSC family protein n=1 Tax=Streptomyces alkaliterrae TaxID=2213162 RepID=A0A5P0YQS9_9ACTN|nr:aromatic acid exporter family protein [Streptomyces alkaliterrae]MBB1253268.1 hypothetical protein [Streptomyces alkaliterrae]MBB1258937.1 hypothetical protein [Streptomyces alkaliterrae]MQS02661.1 hypothetical protein [Streptomyces alkaliterrae]
MGSFGRFRPAEPWHAVRRDGGLVLDSAVRAVREEGRERDLAAQSLKSALAALVAWALASTLLADSLSLMAPWVAVVLVQATVYQSLSQGVRQALAIVLGTALATGTALALDNQILAMALVLPVTLLIGNLPSLGSQGIHVATSAIFALVGGPLTLLISAERVAAALIGAVVGIAVNALVRPPRYLRNALEAIRSTTGEAADLLRDMADGLAEEADEWRAEAWVERAERLPRLAEEVRSALAWDEESLRMNIRHRRSGTALPPDYTSRDVVNALWHVADHTEEIARTLAEAARSEAARRAEDSDSDARREVRPPLLESWLRSDYRALLRDVADAVEAYGGFVTSSGRQEQFTVRDAAARAIAGHDRLRHRIADAPRPGPDTVEMVGPLLADARRLVRQVDG